MLLFYSYVDKGVQTVSDNAITIQISDKNDDILIVDYGDEREVIDAKDTDVCMISINSAPDTGGCSIHNQYGKWVFHSH